MFSRKLMIAGTFRSGTNVAQYCLREFFNVTPVFNEWFWKHGMPPTCIKRPIPKNVPVLIMVKEPVSFNVSLFRFWRARRPELNVGLDLSEFVRQRLIVYDNTGDCISPKYCFPNPTEYWNQFYFSWMNWRDIDDRRVFCRVEDLMTDPEGTLLRVAEGLGISRKNSRNIVLPVDRKGPALPRESLEENLMLNAEDVRFINSAVDQEIMKRLGYM